MQFRILGPLEAAEGGVSLQLGPQKQRALLAVLLLNANRTVSSERIVDELWGESAPETARKAVQTHVSRLRKSLPAGTLVTRPAGYAILLEPGELDLERFEQLRAEGREALARGDAATASAVLDEAFELWRGDALAEFAAEPFARGEGARLEELRVSTLELRIEADLALGRHADLVPELEALAARRPLRERPRALLMLALYRCGRQADALAVYRDARRSLVDELGIEPAAELQELERAILRHDPSLELPFEPSSGLSPHRRADPQTLSPEPDRALTPFVGRERELGFLRATLEDALDGRGRLVFLTGEPGIGKSRTALELATIAHGLGARVLRGRCFEREGAPPYWPWREALRTHVADCPQDRLRNELGSEAAVIAEALPEIRARLGDVGPRPEIADERQSQFRLLDSLANFIGRAAERQALVIVLEDLHAADAGSLALLELLARGLASTPVLVVGTYRDLDVGRAHVLSQTLVELLREGRCERVVLQPLSEAEVSALIAAETDVDPGQELTRAVHDRTNGNPLFVTEVVRQLTEKGRLEDAELGLDGDVPGGVREMIGQRLDRLSERANEVVVVGAVIGREFGLDQLEPLFPDREADDLLTLLEEGLEAHIVEEVPGAAGRFRFAHPLVRETAEAELSTTRRVRLHARIAAALEELYGSRAGMHAPELAYHLAESETIVGPAPLIHWATLAGEQAYEAHAYDDAIAWYQRALAARGDQPLDEASADLLFALVRSEFLGRDWLALSLTLERMEQAFDFYATSGNERLAIEVAAHPIPPVWGHTGVPALLERALALADPSSLEAGRILANLGRFAGTNDGDYGRARLAFERSLAIARAHGDASLERRVLALAARVDWWFLRWEDCTARSREALDLALAADDRQTELYARTWLARDAAIRGDADTAVEEAATSLELAERLGERYWIATARLNSFWLASFLGDWDTARSFSDAGLRAAPRDARNLAVRTLLERELGREAAGAAYLARLIEAMKASAPGSTIERSEAAATIALLARTTGQDGDLGTAIAAGEAVLADPVRIPIFDLQARIGLALAAVIRNDAAAALEHYQALEPQQGTLLITFGLAADRLLGSLALTTGDCDRACRAFEAASVFCERAGYAPERARTAVDWAEALRLRGAPGDGQLAAALVGQALAAARELGMVALEERAARFAA